MRIGIVELYFGKSGKKGFYNNQEIGIARAMKKRGYDSVIFYPQNDTDTIEEEIVEDNIRIVYVPARIIGNHSRYDWNVLVKYKVDVVQIGSDNQIFAPELIRFCEKNNIKLYNYIGTTKSDTDSAIKSLVMRTLYWRNVAVFRKQKCFVKTVTVKKELEKYGIKGIRVAPVGLDTSIIPDIQEDKDIIQQRLLIPHDAKVVLFVGRIDPYKRPLEAVKLLNDLPDCYYMIMIGTGSLDAQIDQFIIQNGLSNRIRRIKRIPNTEIHQYYKAADYFLNFNEKEIFGMSILEAMYQDCNVIAFQAPGPKEIITDQENGFLVNTINEMKNILVDEKTVPKGAAKQAVLGMFTWDKTVEQFDSWIKAEN